MSRLELVGLAAAAVAVGTVYVLVHEARRKHKKAVKLAREAPITKEMLVKILNKSAEASKAVIERVRRLSARPYPIVRTTEDGGTDARAPCLAHRSASRCARSRWPRT